AWLLRQKSLGAKRRDIPDGVERTENYIPYIVKLFEDFTDGNAPIPADPPRELRAKIFQTTAFGYRKVTIERPLRLNFQASPEPDPDLRDTENVPLGEDVQKFFEREVKPHVLDAWVNETIRDEKDGEVGVVGYEINFNRYFYRYQPPRKLEAIEADIKAVEAD